MKDDSRVIRDKIEFELWATPSGCGCALVLIASLIVALVLLAGKVPL